MIMITFTKYIIYNVIIAHFDYRCQSLLRQSVTSTSKNWVLMDIISFIDSYGFISHPEFIKDNTCDMIVENFNDLIDKYLEAKCAENRSEIKNN